MTPKMFITLLALIRNNGTVMTREELMDIIWPDTAVEENNLTQYVSALRKILNNGDKESPRIETLPKRGYRLIANVREITYEEDVLVVQKHTRAQLLIEEEEIKEDAAYTTNVIVRRSATAQSLGWLSNRKVAAVCLSLISLLVAFITWKGISAFRQRALMNFPASIKFTQIESWKGEPGDALARVKFSPDGKLVALPLVVNGQLDIYIKQVNGSDPVQIINDEWKEHDPIWSPDGQVITFISDRGGQKGIWTVPYLGGTPNLLKSLDRGDYRLQSWSKDKTKIYYESQRNFFAFDSQTGETVQLTDFDSTKSMAENFFVSPDEKQIAYADIVSGQSDIFISFGKGNVPVQLTNDEATDDVPVWLPDGKGIVYSSNRNGIYQIFVAYLDGREPQQITFGDNNCFVGDIATDGSRILYRAIRENSDLWRINSDNGEERQITSGVSLELWQDISPDGSTIAFHSIGTIQELFNGSLVVQPVEAARAKKVELAVGGFEPKWSPDGNHLAFLRFSDDKTIINLWSVSKAGIDLKQITTGGVLFEGYSYLPYNKTQVSDYCWSLDGNWLVYCSDKSGAWNIWTISADGQQERNISNNIDPDWYCTCPLFSPDGKRIVYQAKVVSTADKKSTKRIYLFDGEKNDIAFETDSYIKVIGWTASGSDVLLASIDQPNRPRLPVMDVILLSISKQSQPINLHSIYLNNIQLSPDRRFVAFAAREGERDFIRIVPVSGGQSRTVKEAIDNNTYFSSLVWSPDSRAIYYARQERWHIVSMIENFKP